MTDIYLATEDELSETLARKLVKEADQDLQITVPIQGGGFGKLRKMAPQLLKTSHSVPIFLLTDLDTAPCPPTLQSDWGLSPLPEDFLFRIAIREVEAWLLADREGFATFINAPLSQVPQTPETLTDPKLPLLRLIHRYGNRIQRVGMVNSSDTNLKQGLEYNLQLCAFIQSLWSLERARPNANSLDRAYQRLQELGQRKAPS